MSARSLSFGKDKRLTRAADFALVRTKGQTHRGSLLVIGVKTDAETSGVRAGFVTSKRIGNAVKRNRVRRRLREIVRRRQNELKSNIWFVIIARPAAARASYQELRDEWLLLAKRASILAP